MRRLCRISLVTLYVYAYLHTRLIQNTIWIGGLHLFSVIRTLNMFKSKWSDYTHILTEKRNCEILILLQIYKNDQNSKFMFTCMLLKTFLRQIHKMVRKRSRILRVWCMEGGVVISSFTHLVGGLFIAGIQPCKAWEHGQRCQIIGECLRNNIQ